MSKIKENILWFRKKRKWSQEQMAAVFDTKRNKIASYETGDAKPGIELLAAICKDLHVYLHEFIYEDMETYYPVHESQVNEEQQKILSSKDQKIIELQAAIEQKDMVIELQKYKLQGLEKKLADNGVT